MITYFLTSKLVYFYGRSMELCREELFKEDKFIE